MITRKWHRRFLCLGSITVLLYLTGGPGSLAVPLRAWTSGGTSVADCGCDGGADCCGAACCTPRTASCCETPAAAINPASGSAGGGDVVWTTACTCGPGPHRTQVLTTVHDPHVVATVPAAIDGPGSDRLAHAPGPAWPSPPLDPLDQVPRLL